MGSPGDNHSWLHSNDNEARTTCQRTQVLVDHQVFDDMPERIMMWETNLGSSSSSSSSSPWKFGSQAQGWMLLIFGSVSFFLFAFAAGLSKLLPASGNPIIAAIQNDRYYCFLVPLTLPVLVVAVSFHWLSMKLFKHA